jgi:hypothetical protein
MRPAFEPIETRHVRLPQRPVAAVTKAAERDCETVSEFGRQALLAGVRSAGIPLDGRRIAPMVDDGVQVQVEGERTDGKGRERTIADINAEAAAWAVEAAQYGSPRRAEEAEIGRS